MTKERRIELPAKNVVIKVSRGPTGSLLIEIVSPDNDQLAAAIADAVETGGFRLTFGGDLGFAIEGWSPRMHA